MKLCKVVNGNLGVLYDVVKDGKEDVEHRNLNELKKEMRKHPELFDEDVPYCLVRTSKRVKLQKTTISKVIEE